MPRPEPGSGYCLTLDYNIHKDGEALASYVAALCRHTTVLGRAIGGDTKVGYNIASHADVLSAVYLKSSECVA